MTTSMKVGVIGVGALGCLLGAYLGENGDVIMIGHWLDQVTTIKTSGLRVRVPDGRVATHFPAITGNPEEAGPVDIALVVVKSRQTREAAHLAARILKPDGLAITLQNGLNNCDSCARCWASIGPRWASPHKVPRFWEWLKLCTRAMVQPISAVIYR